MNAHETSINSIIQNENTIQIESLAKIFEDIPKKPKESGMNIDDILNELIDKAKNKENLIDITAFKTQATEIINSSLDIVNENIIAFSKLSSIIFNVEENIINLEKNIFIEEINSLKLAFNFPLNMIKHLKQIFTDILTIRKKQVLEIADLKNFSHLKFIFIKTPMQNIIKNYDLFWEKIESSSLLGVKLKIKWSNLTDQEKEDISFNSDKCINTSIKSAFSPYFYYYFILKDIIIYIDKLIASNEDFLIMMNKEDSIKKFLKSIDNFTYYYNSIYAFESHINSILSYSSNTYNHDEINYIERNCLKLQEFIKYCSNVFKLIIPDLQEQILKSKVYCRMEMQELRNKIRDIYEDKKKYINDKLEKINTDELALNDIINLYKKTEDKIKNVILKIYNKNLFTLKNELSIFQTNILNIKNTFKIIYSRKAKRFNIVIHNYANDVENEKTDYDILNDEINNFLDYLNTSYAKTCELMKKYSEYFGMNFENENLMDNEPDKVDPDTLYKYNPSLLKIKKELKITVDAPKINSQNPSINISLSKDEEDNNDLFN
ncbi:hypothetical protein TCON_2404 [Astathelohania contejeani]|uniref:Autophagy-related protein 17 n=1 Tax=Astathelohania contejeani TaxID=164912 RepID=A0ABQ7HW70_9MICR|nr:hypothetical protein TCON_2404 [Thelohania contejeani]